MGSEPARRYLGWHRPAGGAWRQVSDGDTECEAGVRLAAWRPTGGEAALLPEGVSPEGDGMTPTAEEVRRSFLGSAWSDWRVELLAVLGELVLRTRACPDAEVRGRMQVAVEAAPVSWPAVAAWWRRVRDLYRDLAREGRLPEPFLVAPTQGEAAS